MPICDGHDSPIITINLELARHGVELIYLGYNCPASAIARAAIQEDVHAVGISSYNGGHLAFFNEVAVRLRKLGGGHIPLFGGGGGTITPQDEVVMNRRGVDRIFFAGTPLAKIVSTIIQHYGRPPKMKLSSLRGDFKLARAISGAEISKSKIRKAKQIQTLKSQSLKCKSFVVGVTGPGGAGKSTMIDELVRCYLQQHPQGRVAVLANDPSHPDSGGAILGDRVRMQGHDLDTGVFIRSMASRGHLGGLALAVPEAIRLFAAAGMPLVLVETVGVGQVEVEVASATDTTVVVVNPKWGDSIQANKAGLLETADIFVINKADMPGAGQSRRDLEQMLDLSTPGDWRPPILETVSTTGEGVDALWAEIGRHRAFLVGAGLLEPSRRQRLRREFRLVLRARIEVEIDRLASQPLYAELDEDVVEHRLDPYEAAEKLLAHVGDDSGRRAAN